MHPADRPGPTNPVPPHPLRDGCYLIRYTPVTSLAYPLLEHHGGTLRLDFRDGPLAFSGDLYVHLPPTGEDTGEWPFIELFPAYLRDR